MSVLTGSDDVPMTSADTHTHTHITLSPSCFITWKLCHACHKQLIQISKATIKKKNKKNKQLLPDSSVCVEFTGQRGDLVVNENILDVKCHRFDSSDS